MAKWAVGMLHLGNLALAIEIVEADNARQAIFKHSLMLPYETQEWALPEKLEDIKTEFFNGDMAVDVVCLEGL